MKVANPKWERAKHLELLNEELLSVYYKENDRLMCFMPPGHGKSSMISDTFPAWYLGHNPDGRIIFVSYEHDFAMSHGRLCRELFREYGPLCFNQYLSTYIQAADYWGVEGHRGFMKSAGVGGPLTGVRADLIILDDPIKNAEQADSEVYRQKTYDWFITTLRTRLEPGGAIVMVMTRWHEDDLAGRLLDDQKNKDADKWRVISLPAISEEADILGRKIGEPLWPSRFPLEHLEQSKRSNPGRYWSALYQQRPRPDEGGFYKQSYFKYFKTEIIRNPQCLQENNGILIDPPQLVYELLNPDGIKLVLSEDCVIFQTCDPAATEKAKSDYFALGTFAMTPDRELLLLDMFKERAETTKHLDILRQGIIKHDPRFIGIENVSFGLSLIQSAKKEGLPVRPLAADKDKISRALMARTKYETGMIYHPLGARWLDDVETELLDFPNGRHDDVCDVIAYAGLILATSPIPRVVSWR
jgi:predicted phage terminase large subunit-like protein